MAQVSEKDDRFLHGCLPIDKEEKILAVYRHHWFAYASTWLIGIIMAIAIMGIAVVTVTTQNDSNGAIASHKSVIYAGAGLFASAIVLFTAVPVYLKSQERVVLTENSLLQTLQPSLFASKIDQVGLQHVNDVSVRQDFLGTIFGYGHIGIETPGEQDNYEFSKLAHPHEVAQEIVQAHENFDAALQAGKLPTTYGTGMSPTAAPTPVDPAQYQQFLQYQQMLNAQSAAGTTQQPPAVPTPPQPINPAVGVQPPAYQPDASPEQPPTAPAQQ